MLQLPESHRAPITPQLAVRVAMLGGIALLLFAIVFFRLWYLQVLTGDRLLASANSNRVRDIVSPAPRGDIVDRSGRVMVDNRISTAVQVDASKLGEDEGERRALYARLSPVIGVTPAAIDREVKRQTKLLPYANVTLKRDVAPEVRDFIYERQNRFPAVSVNRIYLRSYPLKELAAQIFGTVGEISVEDQKSDRFRGVPQGTVVGKDGLEFSYDRFLRGRLGATRVQVDAFGGSTGQIAVREPEQGRQLKLSVDVDLQRAGQQAMAEAGKIPITDGAKNRGGAFVAMDPRNGEILAMGSYPTFDPNIFAKPLTQAAYNRLNSENTGAPLINRAVHGLYPTGSTFKLVTATAALQSGLITPDTVIDDPGTIQIGNILFKNAGNQAHGAIAMRRALAVSSDVYFYRLGRDADGVRDREGDIIQDWARKLGLGRTTGIDLPGEAEGLVPSPEWRNDLYKQKLTDRPWSVGDNVNFSVGQGDLQATPLQMAVAYSTVANGGKVVTPHLGLRVEDAAGRVLEQVETSPARTVKINEEYRQAILDGLRDATSTEGGTSADVFAGFGRDVMGKTGTAERAGQQDQSWYMAYAPDAKRPIVVAVTVEQGGFGAQTAAPAARLLLSEWFGVEKKLVVGQSATR